MRRVGGAHPNRFGSSGSALFNPVFGSVEDYRRVRCVRQLRVRRFTTITGSLTVSEVARSPLKTTINTVIELGSRVHSISNG